MFAHRLGTIAGRLSSASLLGYQPMRCMANKARRNRIRKAGFLPAHATHMITSASMVTPKRRAPKDPLTRRQAMLNKTFMLHITDFIANDSMGEVFSGYDLEITGLHTSIDYTQLHVYWTTNQATKFDEVQAKLTAAAPLLRHHLIRLHVMGLVPKITFHRDLKASFLAELDAVMERADYGEDYEPGQHKMTLKKKFDTEPYDQDENPLMTMRNDVLGLDHSRIMGHMRANLAYARKKLKDAETDEEPNALGPARKFKLTTSLGEIRDHALRVSRTKEVLLDFLRQNRWQQKMLRQENHLLWMEPKEKEEDVFCYVEDDEAAHNNLFDGDEDEFVADYLYSLSGRATYQFSDSADTNVDEANERSENAIEDEHELK